MSCIELSDHRAARRPCWSSLAALATWLALLAGCGSQPTAPPAAAPTAPAAAPVPVRPTVTPTRPAPAVAVAPPAVAEAPAPAPGSSAVDLGPRVSLPPATPARNMDEFKKMAARRMVASSPKASYMGKPPPMLFGIPILEIELNADGSVRQIGVVRPPANPVAAHTLEYAKEAVRRGAPYGDMSRLPKPWRWTEVFLFNEQNQFKPRSLD